METIVQAIELPGYAPASTWRIGARSSFERVLCGWSIPARAREGRALTSAEMVDFYDGLAGRFPIVSS